MTTKNETTEVVRTDRDGVNVYKVGALEVRNFTTMTKAVQTFVVDVASKVSTSADEATLDIVSGILDADTVETILAESDVIHSEAMVGSAFTLRAVKWGKSALGQGLPFYALLTVSKIGDTDETLMSCSATNVMAQVWSMERHGFLPVDVMLIESERPTANGFRPMRLIPHTTAESF